MLVFTARHNKIFNMHRDRLYELMLYSVRTCDKLHMCSEIVFSDPNTPGHYDWQANL